MSWKKKALDRAFEKVNADKPQTDPEKEKRIEKAKKDFWFFCSYYLSHYFSSEPAEYHKILVEIINTEKIILLMSASQEMANLFLENIKAELEDQI